MYKKWFGLACMLIVVMVNGQNTQKTDGEKRQELGRSLLFFRHYQSDPGSLDFRIRYNSIIMEKIETLLKEAKLSSPQVRSERLQLPLGGLKSRQKISVKFLYEIEEKFRRLGEFFNVAGQAYFLLPSAVVKKKEKFDGVCKINSLKWYEITTGTKLDFAADLGLNRVLGYSFEYPGRIFGFHYDFNGSQSIDFYDGAVRQGLFKLTQDKFLLHNFRFEPRDFAVEVYGMDGMRISRCFDGLPYALENVQNIHLALQTVVTSNRKGHFYVAFQYPMNPYRVWKFDARGQKTAVFGNYSGHPDAYESPEDWIEYDLKQIQRYGVRQIYSIYKMLVDDDGRLIVVLTRNSIKAALMGEHTRECFLDIYSPTGDYLGRSNFEYGLPELVNRGVIYARKKVSRQNWKLTASRLVLQ